LSKAGLNVKGIARQRRAEKLKRKAEMMKVEGADGLGIPFDK
jgi:hypothetical protein